MNLRISENQLRFRIAQSETERLRQNGGLAFSLPLGVQTIEYSVALAEMEQTLALDIQKTAWTLLVDRKDFNQFLASLPSREGIEQIITINGIQITLVLEVDIRRRPIS